MKKTLIIGLSSSINLLILFVYQWYFVRKMGAGNQTDIIFAAQIIPEFIYSLLTSTLIHVMVPQLAKQNELERKKLAWTVLLRFNFIIIIFCLVIFLFAQVWIPWVFPGFSPDDLAVFDSIIPLIIVQIIANCINSILVSKFYAEGKFIKVEILLSVGILIGFLYITQLSEELQTQDIILGFTLKTIIPLIFLFPSIGFRIFHDSKLWDAFWHQLKPLISGSLFYRSEPLIDRSLATLISPGSLTLIAMSRQIYGAGEKLINKSIKNPILLKFSELVKENNLPEIHRLMKRKLIIISSLILFTFLGLMILGKPILSFLFTYKNFTSHEVELFHYYLLLLIIYFAGASLGQITSSVFYAIQDTKTPAIIGSVIFSISIVFKILGVKFFQAEGLILATCFYYFFNFLVGWIIIQKRLKI